MVLLLNLFLFPQSASVSFFFSCRRRHTSYIGDWSSDVCSSDLQWVAHAIGRGSPIATTTDGVSDPLVWTVGSEGDNRLRAFDGDTGAVVFAGGGSAEEMGTEIGRASWRGTAGCGGMRQAA